jgi:hypothetical protein
MKGIGTGTTNCSGLNTWEMLALCLTLTPVSPSPTTWHVWQIIAFWLPYSPEIPRIDPAINNSSHVWRSLMVLKGEKLHDLEAKILLWPHRPSKLMTRSSTRDISVKDQTFIQVFNNDKLVWVGIQWHTCYKYHKKWMHFSYNYRTVLHPPHV